MSYGFLLEYDWNIYVLEFSDVFQTVQSVSGKSADGLGDNHVDVSGLAVVNHTVKVLTLFCVGAGNTIIGVDNGNFQFDELQGQLRAQRRPSCERQHHLRGTGHCPAREVSTSNPHNESIKNAHLEKSRWAFFRVRGFA